jgi:hypothetical protein
MILPFEFNTYVKVIIMFRFRTRITISLTGGLGNQLYQFYAGQFLAKKLDVTLKYTHNPLPKDHPQENSNIQSFLIDKKIRPDFVFSVMPKIVTRIYKGLMRRSSVINDVSNFVGGIYFESRFEPIAEQAEISKSLEASFFRKRRVKGYFQDFRYFLEVKSDQELILKNPSDWFLEMVQEVTTDQPVIIHLRLGDYLKQPYIWGVLDKDYYLNGLKLIKDNINFDTVWVFSDDLKRARFILKDLKEFNLRFIDPSERQDPAEVLKLISMGIAQIVSNSTFSLWAAVISKSSRITIVPDPVFRNMQGQARGLPNDWIKVESIWAENARVSEIIAATQEPY